MQTHRLIAKIIGQILARNFTVELDEYLNHPRGMATDIKFCLGVCTTVAFAMINQCMANTAGKAA